MDPILVTGATGKTGGAVAAELLRRGRSVRAVVRAVDSRSERLAAAGAEVVVADIFDHDQLLGAMRGVSRAYYCPPWHPFMLQSAAAFAVAARGARLEAVVALGQWLANPVHPSLQTRQTWLADRLFSMIPEAAHVIINPGYFADNYLNSDLIEYAAHLGIYPTPTGASLNAPPSNEDIARVAVAALLDPARHAGRTYRPTGPALISAHDAAAILERVLERRVRPFDMPLPLFMKAAAAAGFAPFMVADLRTYVEEHRRGTFAHGAPNTDVADVTGREPEDFETIVRRYTERIDVRPTLTNRLRTLGKLVRVPLMPARDVHRYTQESHYPEPPRALLSADAPAWRDEHRTVGGSRAAAV